ncbi:NAD-binding domain 4 protein [Stipitochalara longipes BDJ]|nr:NAD-binding domain 4 protein [Stipitochalara longipes BDJ]
MEGSSRTDYVHFFKDQTVFLTGATGGLGGCILYKLASELQTHKIFVLCRSESKARATWNKTMPNQIDSILNSDRVKLVVGDILKPNFGIVPDLLAEITAETTIVIHSAANTSFSLSVRQAIDNNCMSVLHLAKMISSFPQLRQFVQVSTGYCNSNQPDGLIEEKIYPLGDPEEELREITTTGTSLYASSFPWPYGYAKHLTERLLFSRYPNLPVLVVRPTCIGSAMSQPFPLYGPISATPIEQCFRLLTLNPGTGIIHAAEGQTTGTNIFDEIPVDWVSNLILLHAAAGTRGVIHAGAKSFIPRSFDHHFETLLDDKAKKKISFATNKDTPQCIWADFYKVITRGWVFSNQASEKFRDVAGPLSISLDGLDLEEYDRGRRAKVQAEVAASRRRARL